MSKILEATCLAGVVKVGALPVTSAVILSEGVAQSSGALLMEGDEQFYIPKITPDLKTTLENLSSTLADVGSALTQTAAALTAIGANMLGPATAPPPTLAASVAAITAKVTTIAATKVLVDTLKGALK